MAPGTRVGSGTANNHEAIHTAESKPMSTETELAGYGTHLRRLRDELVAENELLRALLREVRLYQFPGYMEWLKRRDQALTKATP